MLSLYYLKWLIQDMHIAQLKLMIICLLLEEGSMVELKQAYLKSVKYTVSKLKNGQIFHH